MPAGCAHVEHTRSAGPDRACSSTGRSRRRYLARTVGRTAPSADRALRRELEGDRAVRIPRSTAPHPLPSAGRRRARRRRVDRRELRQSSTDGADRHGRGRAGHDGATPDGRAGVSATRGPRRRRARHPPACTRLGDRGHALGDVDADGAGPRSDAPTPGATQGSASTPARRTAVSTSIIGWPPCRMPAAPRRPRPSVVWAGAADLDVVDVEQRAVGAEPRPARPRGRGRRAATNSRRDAGVASSRADLDRGVAAIRGSMRVGRAGARAVGPRSTAAHGRSKPTRRVSGSSSTPLCARDPGPTTSAISAQHVVGRPAVVGLDEVGVLGRHLGRADAAGPCTRPRR